MDDNVVFYDALAEHYHLIFQDWEASMCRQGPIIASLLPVPDVVGAILDCACGIGTQTLALARLGYRIDASDLSAAEVARADREAVARGFSVRFRVDDMRVLGKAPVGHYGALLCMDNALPHLDSDEDIVAALGAMRARLTPGGTLVLSLRDYAPLVAKRPSFTPPSFFDDGGARRIVFQIWDWQDDRRYTVHLHISQQNDQGWESRHFVGWYRAVPTHEVVAMAIEAGFERVLVHAPDETGYYQPIITAIRPLS